MKMKHLAPLALVLLAACGGNPIGAGNGGGGGDGGGPDPVTDVPVEVAANLKAISYDPVGDTLTISLDNPGASPLNAQFTRTPGLDVNGYDAYVYQETGLLRSHLALVKENARGNLQAAAVSDGGQFNYRFGGGSFVRIDTYTQPTTGVFSYTGSYAGVFVPGNSASPALPDSFEPITPYRVAGDILVNGSFTTNIVEGGVTGRQVLDDNGNAVLDLTDIVLKNTTIDSDGRFLGDVEFTGEPGTSIGNYAGAFGGAGATDVAGALLINPISGESGIWEFGVWNLPACGTAGEGPLCALQ